MKETAQNMMTKAMAGMMSPEDMPKMMDTVFGEMSTQDRVAFVGEMMPEDHRSVATAMLERMQAELKSQVDGDAQAS